MARVALVEVILFSVGAEWSSDFFSVQFFPVEVAEPRVVLYFFGPVQAQSVLGFTLNAFINEVHGFAAPALWQIFLLNLDLFGEDMVADLLSVFANEGALPEHTLISNHTHCKIVNSHSVILAAHHLWGHVAGSSRRVFCILRIQNPRDTQICYT